MKKELKHKEVVSPRMSVHGKEKFVEMVEKES